MTVCAKHFKKSMLKVQNTIFKTILHNTVSLNTEPDLKRFK